MSSNDSMNCRSDYGPDSAFRALRRRSRLLMTVEQTLAELVAIDSVSSRSNAAIISYLHQRCESLGLLVEEYSHVDANGQTKINLVARTSAVESHAETLQLALVGHTDTVPYD